MSIPLSAQLTKSVGLTGITPAHLLELMDVNGNCSYWADRLITAPLILAPSGSEATTAAYQPWLLEVPALNIFRSLQTGTGQFTLQNLSGNSLVRDFDVLLRKTAVEGSLFTYRMWQPESMDSWMDWFGVVTLSAVTERTTQFTARDLYDVNLVPSQDRQYSECCPWLWGSQRCGVTVVPPDGGDFVLISTPPTPPAIGPLGLTGSSGRGTRPNFIPTPIPPGDPGGGSPGDPGNPGGGSGGTVTSSQECFYSFESCQAPERFGGILNNYETNYGEALARMAGYVATRLRKV